MLRIGTVVAAGLILALAACAPQPVLTSTPEPEVTIASPTPTPSATASAQLFLGPDGVGSLRLGEPVGDDDTFMRFNPVGCGDMGIPEGEPYAGFWEADLPDVMTTGGFPVNAFFANTANGLPDGDVVSIMVLGGLTTATGVGVGDSREDVMAAYPDGFDHTESGFASDVYVIDGEAGSLIIEVTRETEDPYWEPDQIDTVLVLRSTIGATGPLAGSDGGGPCPL